MVQLFPLIEISYCELIGTINSGIVFTGDGDGEWGMGIGGGGALINLLQVPAKLITTT